MDLAVTYWQWYLTKPSYQSAMSFEAGLRFLTI